MENDTRNYTQMSYPNAFEFSFETNHSILKTSNWMKKYWTLSFLLVFIYITMIHFGREYMKNRPRYNLRGPLFVWNALLAMIYFIGLARGFTAYSSLLYRKGYHNFICGDCPFGCHSTSLFWGWIFVLLKAPELLDTAFVILRKQPLFFLHYYHHCTVLIFTWYLYGHVSSPGTFYGLVNGYVHALMYFYYALKSLSVRVPRPISMALTVIQISQMAVGCYTNYYVFQLKKAGGNCHVFSIDIWAAFVIYVSYFILFLWYFYQAYVVKDALIIAKMKGEKIE